MSIRDLVKIFCDFKTPLLSNLVDLNQKKKGNKMKRTTLFSFAIVFFLSFTIWNMMAQQNYKSRDGKQRQERFAEKLNLTTEQQSAIEQLKIENQKEMIDLKADLQRKKLDLKELKSKGNYTREEYLNLVEQLIILKIILL